MAKKYRGRCTCGAVTFEFDSEPAFIANCHCLDCKKASGGEMATFFGVPQSDFTLTSGVPKAFYHIAESGKGLDRNFCPACGSRLFTSNLASFPGTVFVMLGSLDHTELIAPKLEMFTDPVKLRKYCACMQEIVDDNEAFTVNELELPIRLRMSCATTRPGWGALAGRRACRDGPASLLRWRATAAR